ncbi:hypothetical protein ACF0H5_022752 [Mactra antiquata]
MRGKDLLIGAAVGASAVVAAPVLLSAVGFGSAGVIAGSIAAAIQTPATAAGSYFALAQSAGVVGMAVSTQATIGATVGGATYIAKKIVK